jgi:undecaprenyl-diphosphatase
MRIVLCIMLLFIVSTAIPAGADSVQARSGDSLGAAPSYAESADSMQVETAGAARPAVDEDSLDVRLFRLLNGSIRNALFDFLMPVVTDFRRSRVIVILVWAALVIFGGPRGRWAGLMLILLVAASDQLSSHLIKPLVERMRPCELLGSVHFWYGPEGWLVTPPEVVGGFKTSFSFPSSHAANITSSMLFLALAYRRWAALPIVVMILVSFSRIYVGVHWPSDVMAGMALGAILAVPVYLIFRRISFEKKKSVENIV